MLWFQYHIPKSSVISWMAVLNRLSTKDRLVSWGMSIEECCLFCHQEKETRDHLFFGCGHSKSLWQMVLNHCKLHKRLAEWNEELQWTVCKLKGRALVSIILHIAWNAFIYHMLRERNNRLYSHVEETEARLRDHIKGSCLHAFTWAKKHCC